MNAAFTLHVVEFCSRACSSHMMAVSPPVQSVGVLSVTSAGSIQKHMFVCQISCMRLSICVCVCVLHSKTFDVCPAP